MPHSNISRHIVLTLTVAALLVPAARATGTAAGKDGSLDPWAYAAIHSHAGSIPPTTAPQATRVPEIIAGISPRVARVRRETAVPPDVRAHRLVGQLVGADRASSQSGFDWDAAGIGAGVTVAAVLAALVATLLFRGARRGRALTPSKLSVRS